MLNKSKLIAAVAIIASGLATPALAQEFANGWGTGNVLPSYYDNGGKLHAGMPNEQTQVAVHRSGLSAFGRIPSAQNQNAGYDPSAATQR